MTEYPPPATEAAFSILVVDDDPMVREVTTLMLTEAGHKVHEAADGAAALLFLLDMGPVDLLITDINMPNMGGLELVQQAKARWPDLPVLLVSGRVQPPRTQAGSPPFMAKPFGLDALIRAVGRVVPKPKGGV